MHRGRMDRYGALAAELEASLLPLLADSPSRAELEREARALRLGRKRALDLWNECWTLLRDERPEAFDGDFRRALIDTQALAYLYVRRQFADYVPPLRLTASERGELEALRQRFRALTGLAALARPARLRLVREGCPLLDAERRAFCPKRAAMTFAWSPGPVRRVVLVYESTVEDLRADHTWWLLAIVLHEELHSAVHLAAGSPAPYADDDAITPLVEELCVSLLSNVAELLLLDGRLPTRRRLRAWNEMSSQGALLNRLLDALPGDGEAIAPAAAALAVAAVAAGDAEAVLALLASGSRRGVVSWRRLLDL